MTFSSLVKLLSAFLRRNRQGAAFSAFGIALGIGALVFFVALGLGVNRVIRENVFPVESQLVDVVPSSISLGALWGGGKIDQTTVDRLAALPGVEAAYRKMIVRVPAVTRYDGAFFGSQLRMGAEMIAVGVDPEFVAQEVKTASFRDPPAGQPIPAVVSKRLLEIYNKTFAPARKLPQISAEMILGFTFPVEFNRSFVAAQGGGRTTPTSMQAMGASQRGLLAGVTIPLDTAIRINREHNADAETFSSVTLKARNPDDVPAIVAAVKGMGLEIDEQERRLAQNVGAAVAVVTATMGLLSALICLLAAVNIGHALSAAVRARSRELGIMRAVGASRSHIQRLVFAEAGVLGCVGGLVGVVSARGMAWGVDFLSAKVLPPFPFQPESYFLFPIWLWLGAWFLGLLAACVGAYGPARQASQLDPARVLAG